MASGFGAAVGSYYTQQQVAPAAEPGMELGLGTGFPGDGMVPALHEDTGPAPEHDGQVAAQVNVNEAPDQKRDYSKSVWGTREMLVLSAAKENESEKLKLPGEREKRKHLTGAEKWREIENFCWAHMVQRSSEQCKDKWEAMLSAFKKVHDHEEGVQAGVLGKSYWDLSGEERREVGAARGEAKFPVKFEKDVYSHMARWLGQRARKRQSLKGEGSMEPQSDVTPGKKRKAGEMAAAAEEVKTDPSLVKRKKSESRQLTRIVDLMEQVISCTKETVLRMEERADQRQERHQALMREQMEVQKASFEGLVSSLSQVAFALSAAAESACAAADHTGRQS